MNIGFIGMGIMGKPMAINLHKAGHTVVVHGRRPETMTPPLEAGCAGCERCIGGCIRRCIAVGNRLAARDAPGAEVVLTGRKPLRGKGFW